MAERGLWGNKPRPAEPVDLKAFVSALVQHKGLRPYEVAEMTFPELLLYCDPPKNEISVQGAVAKIRLMRSLPVEHYLALARLRTGEQ